MATDRDRTEPADWPENFLAPTGDFYPGPAVPGRWFGNRGNLHGDDRRRVREWDGHRWLACVTDTLGPPETFMTPGHHTEVFFHDEATALAAGHRPCWQCRRPDGQRFQQLFFEVHGITSGGVSALDDRLHADRLTADGTKRTFTAELESLPDGTFVRVDGDPWVRAGGSLHRWTVDGYDQQMAVTSGDVEVLTPKCTVEVLRAGYQPDVILGS
jgi:hypothetical protein